MTTTDTITPKSLLTRAADIIEERGWYQGSWTGNGGCVCTWGALNVALAEAADLVDDEAPKPPDPDYVPGDLYNVYASAEMTLANAIIDASCDTGMGIAEWNDAPGRTKSEVQDLLRRAAGGA
jgi:hypothetical protein